MEELFNLFQHPWQKNVVGVQPEKPFALCFCKSLVQRITLPGIRLDVAILDNHLQLLAQALRFKGRKRILEERPIALHRNYTAKKWSLVGHAEVNSWRV